jgi:hypothetical protein
MAHNLQYAAGQRLYLDHNPKGIPRDFSLSKMVFDAVASRIGELRAEVGDIVLVYRYIESLNALPEKFETILDQYRIAQKTSDSQVDEHRGDLETTLGIYRDSLERLVNLLNNVLPRLRRRATPWYRIDLRIRREPTLSLEDLAARVAQIAERRTEQSRGE